MERLLTVLSRLASCGGAKRLAILLLVIVGAGYAQTNTGVVDGTLNVSTCGSATPPAWCSGSDIGAWVMAGASHLAFLGYQGGGLIVEATGICYQFATPIVFTLPFSLRGQGPDATCLQYSATSGTAITYNTGNRAAAGYGLHDLQLAGPPGGGTATGIALNGAGAVVEDVVVGGGVGGVARGFHTGLLFGANSYLSTLSDSEFQYNDQNVYFPGASTPLNSGENVVFSHVTFANGKKFTNCVQIGDLGYDGPQVTFISSSFDDCQLINKDSAVTLVGGHLELVSPQSDPYIVTVDDFYLGFSGAHSTTLLGTQIFGNPPNATLTGNGHLEVDRFGSLNILGLIDRGSMLIPLVYLNMGDGGTPKFFIFAPDNQRTAAQLYSVAAGTSPVIANISNGQFDMLNGYKATKVQMSDGSGPNGDFPKYAADGSLTDSGYGPSAFPTKTGTEVAGHLTCWKATGLIGYCSNDVTASGTCTCQ